MPLGETRYQVYVYILIEERMVIKILKFLQYLKTQEVELVFEAEYLFLLGSHPNGGETLLGRRCLQPCGSREAKVYIIK